MTIADLDDDQLLARLARMARRLDPVPEAVAEGARDSFTWRTIDAELAELVYDSRGDRELAGVRSAESSRQLTFQGPELTVEVELSAEGALVGQLVPPQAATVEVRQAGAASRVVTADRLGRFAAGVLAHGPVSLLCRRGPGRPAVATAWLGL